MDLNIYSIPNGWNPPLSYCSPNEAEEVDADSLGRRLMTLVRALDKARVDPNERSELRTLLRSMHEIFSRKGLLQGDAKKAEKILAFGLYGSQFSTIGGGAGRRDKKGRTKRNADDTRIMNDIDAKGESGDLSAADDEQLILTGLSRLLGGTQDLSSPRIITEASDLPSFQLAAQVCSAIIQHVRLLLPDNSCALAEYDLLAGCGRSILTGVARTTKALLCTNTALSNDQATTVEACFVNATSLISLLGTRLARSSPVVESLREAGWDAICQQNEKVQQAAARLLASLTLTGVDSVAPADSWTKAIYDGIAGSLLLIQAIAPLKRKMSTTDPIFFEKVNNIILQWIGRIRESLPDEATKVAQFRASLGGLVAYIVALFQREFVDFHSQKALNAACLPISEILGLIEYLLSFPSLSESSYHGTKKRLRLEAIQEGILSPYAVATDVANYAKFLGQTLFQVVLDGLGRPSLLQYGRQLTALVCASLQNACSGALKKALDPVSIVKLDGTRKRWLHQSVALRTKGVQNARSLINGLGSNLLMETLTHSHGRSRTSNGGASIVLNLAGCAIEQILWDGKDEDWGRLDERIDLASNAIDSLAVALDSCGGYMPFKTRSVIDTTALTCLNQYVGRSSSKIACWSQVKVASLNLGISCVCTPWPDSAMSELTTTLKGIAQLLANDSDRCVSALSHRCLQVCNLQLCQRAPPMWIAIRSMPNGETERSFEIASASAIIESLHAVKSEVIKDSEKAQPKSKRKTQQSKANVPKKKKSKLHTPPPSAALNSPSVEEDDLNMSSDLQEDGTIRENISEEVPMDQADWSRFKNELRDDADDISEDDDGDFMPGIVDSGPDGDDDED